MKTIEFSIITVLLLFAVLRAGNALLIHENAQVVVIKQLCPIVNGREDHDVCIVNANRFEMNIQINTEFLLFVQQYWWTIFPFIFMPAMWALKDSYSQPSNREIENINSKLKAFKADIEVKDENPIGTSL